MAVNKFATMLHRNTHKITIILVYAVLEWILILLLLLNSLFTYLIAKFANYFGLKPPCLWCSRVDHILEPGKNTNSYRDLVCDTHATEISKLSYCSNHKKLAESQNMCEDCSASRQTRPSYNGKSIEMSQRIAFISWVSVNKCENGEEFFRCSCCNESFSSKLHSPYLLLKPSWGVLDYTQKGDLFIEALDDNNNGGEHKVPSKPASPAICSEDDCEIERTTGEDHKDGDVADEHQILSDDESLSFREEAEDCSRSLSNLQCDKKEATENEKAGTLYITQENSNGKNFTHRSTDATLMQCCSADDNSIINLHSKNHSACDFYRLIPPELIDFLTIENQGSCSLKEEDLRKHEHQNGTLNRESQIETQVNVLREAAVMKDSDENTKEYESLDMGLDDIENSSVLNAEVEKQDLIGDACERVVTTQGAQTSSIEGNDVKAAAVREQGGQPAPEEELDSFEMLDDQTKSKTLISTEMPDPAAYQPTAQEPIPSVPCLQEDQSSTKENEPEICIGPDAFTAQTDLGPRHTERAIIQEQVTLVDKNQEGINHHLSVSSEPNEAEEEKLPDTPTSIESLQYLHKKLLLFEKRESGMEDSLDGSVVSEMEGGDAVPTIERLKATLKAERKALSALYAELEEERSASAIAANQTMAMITRLQEEKAAMQMEALQYQRMMEEQSEYDQEALQLLNELMIKREKEKQELEKELEVYRDKVLDYEMKEKMRMMRRTKDGSVRSRNSSSPCSNAGDSDELSIDLNREARDEDSSIYGHQESSNNNTPADAVLDLEEMALDCVKHMSTLDESLAEFEEERLSILDQLKALEEKLLTLDDDEEFCKDVKSTEPFSNYSVEEFDKNYDFSSPEENRVSKDLSGKHYPERRTIASMAKRLLPLLDAADNETEEGLTYEEQANSESVEMQNSSVSKFELDSKNLDIVDEVDHVYERLQALETDGEFLKHCMSSINKGDRGMGVLQEILQHLRDLRSVEVRLRNMSGDSQG